MNPPVWWIVVFGYLSIGCGVVAWGAVLIGLEKIQGRLNDELTWKEWVGIFALSFLLWPMMIKDLTSETRDALILDSDEPRCLGCGSWNVKQRVPRDRRMASDRDKEWRKEQVKRRGTRDAEWYLGDRGKDESVHEYNRYVERFLKEPWGDCEDCGAKIDRKTVGHNWASYS